MVRNGLDLLCIYLPSNSSGLFLVLVFDRSALACVSVCELSVPDEVPANGDLGLHLLTFQVVGEIATKADLRTKLEHD